MTTIKPNKKKDIVRFVASTRKYLVGLGALEVPRRFEGLHHEFNLETKGGTLVINLPPSDDDEHDIVYTIYCRFKDHDLAFSKLGGDINVKPYNSKYNFLVVEDIETAINMMKYHFSIVMESN